VGNQDDEASNPAEAEPVRGIRLRGLATFEPKYSNYISVNYDYYSFHIAFARLIAPVFEDDEERARFEREGWTADVTARLIVPPEALEHMIGFLQAQLDNYVAQFETSELDDEPTSSARPEEEDRNGNSS
jgi:hypothetical protein